MIAKRVRAAALGIAAILLGLSAPMLADQPAVPESNSPATDTGGPGITISADGTTVYVIGMLMNDSFLKFDAVVRRAPGLKTVYLGSPGGLTIEGRLIAALVRKRKLDTYVESYCASACTQVFVAGRQRVLGKDGQLGFHQAVMLDDKGQPAGVRARTGRALTSTLVFGVNGNDTLRLAYELAGIDKAFIDKALAREHEDMWLPGTDELIKANVITRRAERSEIAAPQGSYSREQIAGLLGKRAMWISAALAVPEAYQSATNLIWRHANSGIPLDDAISAGRTSIVLAGLPLLKQAGDPLLDRVLALYASSARDQRTRGYPICKARIASEVSQLAPADRAFEASEDLLLVELFMSPKAVPVLSQKDATKIFMKDVAPLLSGSLGGFFRPTGERNCRTGFKTFEVIDALEGKKRIRAYRALLSLPGMVGG